jgi:MFS-type transporter involved in bile tolerance (Atg22 family)
MAFYGIGVPLGGLLGMVLGGWLADQYGWRAAFMIVGAPGVALALVVAMTLREPRMAAAMAEARAKAPPTMKVGAAVKEVLASKAFLLLAAGASVIAFLGYGKGVWTTILFARTHGMAIADVGLYLGLSAGIAGMIGMSLGGFLGDKFGKRDPRHYVTAPAIAMALATPFLYFGYTSPDWRIAMALIFLPAIANSLYYGPTFALAQMLVPPQARALASAIMLFIINLVGLGLGPLAFGALSDAFKPIAGAESVRWVLVCAAFLGLLPAVLFWIAAVIAGLCMGSSQSAGRAMAGLFTPADRRAEFFGLWTFATRLSAVVGLLTYGLLVWLTDGNQRVAMAGTALFFVGGLLLLSKVDIARGAAVAGGLRQSAA